MGGLGGQTGERKERKRTSVIEKTTGASENYSLAGREQAQAVRMSMELSTTMSVPIKEQGSRVRTDFVEHLSRKFGSVTRAWRKVLDRADNGKLPLAEFTAACRACGYMGNGLVLWDELTDFGERKNLTLGDLDPDSFKMFMNFKRSCKRKFKGLKEPFVEREGEEPSKRLNPEEFVEMCRKIRCAQKPLGWPKLFRLLDLESTGTITYEEVKFLESWDKKRPKPVPGTKPGGPLGLSPKSVRSLVRPRSASYLRKKEVIRPNWNARHQILDQPGNWDDQLIYELVHVSSLGREYAMRVLKKAQTEPLSTLFSGI